VNRLLLAATLPARSGVGTIATGSRAVFGFLAARLRCDRAQGRNLFPAPLALIRRHGYTIAMYGTNGKSMTKASTAKGKAAPSLQLQGTGVSV
jgi:hypothetical protein